MPNAAILHGRNCSPDMFWYSYAESLLRKKGYSVWRPQLPNTRTADLHEWLPYVTKNFRTAEESILIGHSASCPLILSILEKTESSVRAIVLVAGSVGLLKSKEPRAILQDSYDWEKIRMNARDIFIINSKNDPYGADDAAGRELHHHLGGKLIISPDQGHFGSIKYNQPYERFPLLKEVINSL